MSFGKDSTRAFYFKGIIFTLYTLLNAQNRFCELREERINNYRLFTGFTDFISHLDNLGQVSELRNRLMQFVPTSINERIFDFSLDQSLGGKGYTLQR